MPRLFVDPIRDAAVGVRNQLEAFRGLVLRHGNLAEGLVGRAPHPSSVFLAVDAVQHPACADENVAIIVTRTGSRNGATRKWLLAHLDNVRYVRY